MFEKSRLQHEIKACQDEIVEIEQRRNRSQAALINAILNQMDPSDQDVEFFNMYTAQIEEVRNKIHALQNQLDILG